MIWIAMAAQAADCPDSAAEDDLVDAIEESLALFSELDDQGFAEAHAYAATVLECMSTPVSPATAASYHRLRGIQAFVAGDTDGAGAAFAASLRVQPEYTPRAAIFPDGSPMRKAYEDARNRATTGESQSLPEGTWHIDGREAFDRPSMLPSVVQRGVPVDFSAWLAANEPVPGGGGGTPRLDPEPDPDPEPITSTRPVSQPSSGGKKGPLVPLTIVSGVVAAGMFGGSVALRGQYEADPTFERRLTTNGVFLGSVGFGITAATLGGIAIFGNK